MSSVSLRYLVGYVGEYLVLLCLRLQLFYVVAHRYRCKHGEIDLIVVRGDSIIFVEVKTSLLNKEIPITHSQRMSILRSSKYFLSSNPRFLRYLVRYDLYFLSLRKWPVYIKNAWMDQEMV